MEPINTFAAELISETFGKSRKKWAVFVFAFVAGVTTALWLVQRARMSVPVVASTRSTDGSTQPDA